ncbi:hypothetical protein HW555_011872 [Spodoptera exigua]|uniref:Uncharacterized protein n=1 Tax=Spodoptera exigua TaxID=7107 RepID=A0A835G875_SPOEX|nr:hypothetical protein HW555_011872 [Spodoptera exigua]
MDPAAVDCELAERDPGMCVCKEGPTLDILKDIQRLYEEKLEQLDRARGTTKLQHQVDLLRSWVSDLVGQNTLLVRAVEELETEATTKLMMERQKNNEVVSELRAECSALRDRLVRKDSDLRGLLEVLRRLRENDKCTLSGIQFFEVTESDIFGSVEWRESKMERGDWKPNSYKQETNKYKISRHYRIT